MLNNAQELAMEIRRYKALQEEGILSQADANAFIRALKKAHLARLAVPVVNSDKATAGQPRPKWSHGNWVAWKSLQLEDGSWLTAKQELLPSCIGKKWSWVADKPTKTPHKDKDGNLVAETKRYKHSGNAEIKYKIKRMMAGLCVFDACLLMRHANPCFPSS